MELGMVGLGRMGANMVRRLMKQGHDCFVFDSKAENIEALAKEGAQGSSSLEDMLSKMKGPRAIWLMVPAAITDKVIQELLPHLEKGDIIIDGGNSYFRDDRRRAEELKPKEIHYVDCGTSGGVWGLERGYCLMIGGEDEVVKHLDPIFKAIAPGKGDAAPTPGREKFQDTAEEGYLHCGHVGAGHFVKMVHNGVEYGVMAAYGEGFGILKNANCHKEKREIDAETAPQMHQDLDYDIDVAAVSEVWRRGSVIGSWLLDLTAQAFAKNPDLSDFSGKVSDSGEGRWTIMAAIEEAVSAEVLTSALYSRFRSRKEFTFADKVCSAMRFMFGGHHEKK